MPSEVGIANAALRKLGQSPITAFNEDSKAARLANERYPEVRDALLHQHPWNFATKRTSLAASTAPEWGPEFSYPVPVDYIRIFKVNGEDERTFKWQLEDGNIVTNLEAPLQIKYVYQVTDPTRMTAGFREALASVLAAEWAEDLTGDESVVEDKQGLARFAVAQARSNDGQEGMPEQLESDDWIDSRL